jgi:hypothetical protein
MSAALLRNNNKYNALEDDWESCLHVLTWTVLRFTKHTISRGGSKRFLRAFDEVYEDEDGVKGGELKKAFLLPVGRDIPRTVKFDGLPQLDALIRAHRSIRCSLRGAANSQSTRDSKPHAIQQRSSVLRS